MIAKPPCDEVAILRGRAAAPCGRAAQRWTLLAAILGSSMAFVDGTVVNVALPALRHELGATASQVQWVIESYALFLASLLFTGEDRIPASQQSAAGLVRRERRG